MCVCVCERQRDRQTERQRQRQSQTQREACNLRSTPGLARESEGERERERERQREREREGGRTRVRESVCACVCERERKRSLPDSPGRTLPGRGCSCAVLSRTPEPMCGLRDMRHEFQGSGCASNVRAAPRGFRRAPHSRVSGSGVRESTSPDLAGEGLLMCGRLSQPGTRNLWRHNPV